MYTFCGQKGYYETYWTRGLKQGKRDGEEIKRLRNSGNATECSSMPSAIFQHFCNIRSLNDNHNNNPNSDIYNDNANNMRILHSLQIVLCCVILGCSLCIVNAKAG